MKKILNISAAIAVIMGLLNILAGVGIIGNFDDIQRTGGLLGGSMAIGLAVYIIWLRIVFKDSFD